MVVVPLLLRGDLARARDVHSLVPATFDDWPASDEPLGDTAEPITQVDATIRLDAHVRVRIRSEVERDAVHVLAIDRQWDGLAGN